MCHHDWLTVQYRLYCWVRLIFFKPQPVMWFEIDKDVALKDREVNTFAETKTTQALDKHQLAGGR